MLRRAERGRGLIARPNRKCTAESARPITVPARRPGPARTCPRAAQCRGRFYFNYLRRPRSFAPLKFGTRRSGAMTSAWYMHGYAINLHHVTSRVAAAPFRPVPRALLHNPALPIQPYIGRLTDALSCSKMHY